MLEKENQTCPLCHHDGELFYKDHFYLCSGCRGIFRSSESYPTPHDEKARYETHNNDVDDPDYQNFTSPITQAVMNNFSSEQEGLDFGAGTGPVISKILQDYGYDIKQYDPFFHHNPDLLRAKYDYVVCCEVIEHFHDPEKEFTLLRELLYPGGHLYCMTALYDEDIDFYRWYYKNDKTHTFFYQEETLRWIKDRFDFTSMVVRDRLVKFIA